MSNPNKNAGTRFCSAVVIEFHKGGFPDVERRVQYGKEDRGDIAGVDAWALECKAEKTIALSEYMREAEIEAENAGVPNHAAIVKKRMAPVGDAYTVQPLWQFIRGLKEREQLLARVGELEAEVRVLGRYLHGTEEGAA